MPIKYRHEPDFNISAILEFVAARQAADRQTDEINRRSDVARVSTFGDALGSGVKFGIGAGMQKARDNRLMQNQITIDDARSKARIDQYLMENFGVQSLEEASAAAEAGGQDVMSFLRQFREEQLAAEEGIKAQAEGKVFGIPPEEQSIMDDLDGEIGAIKSAMMTGQGLDAVSQAAGEQRITELEQQKASFQQRWFKPKQSFPSIPEMLESKSIVPMPEMSSIIVQNPATGEITVNRAQVQQKQEQESGKLDPKLFKDLWEGAMEDAKNATKFDKEGNEIPSTDADIEAAFDRRLAAYQRAQAKMQGTQGRFTGPEVPVDGMGPQAIPAEQAPPMEQEVRLPSQSDQDYAKAAKVLDYARRNPMSVRKTADGMEHTPSSMLPETVMAAETYLSEAQNRYSNIDDMPPEEREFYLQARKILLEQKGLKEKAKS